VKTEETGTPSPVEGLGQIISDDKGRTDILDLQYFAFNLLALAYVVVAFMWALRDGFPEVPETLFGLTGAAALAYTSKKIADRSVPTVTSVSPRRVRAGDVLEIWGQNLVVGPGKSPRVELDGRAVAAVEVVKERGEPAAGGGAFDHLRVTVPALSGNDTVELVVIPEGGRPTTPMELEADRGGIAAVEPTELQLGRDRRLLIRGTGLAETGRTTRVLIGDVEVTVEGTAQPDLVIATLRPDQLHDVETGHSVRLTVLVDGISLSRLIQVRKPEITGVAPMPIERDVSKPVEITGTALDGRPCTVKLGDRDLDVASQSAEKIVARLRSADLSQYPNDTELVATVGSYEVRKQVSVKP
jgi:hypothetical protein